jgi:hypothetical protein
MSELQTDQCGLRHHYGVHNARVELMQPLTDCASNIDAAHIGPERADDPFSALTGNAHAPS